MKTATSILEFLTKENPKIKLEEVGDKRPNTHGSYSTPKQLVKWTEFSFDTLKKMYSGNLMITAEEERSSLPPYPYLSPSTDRSVQCEKSTMHVLTKWTHNIVQPALDALDGRFNACRWPPFAGKKSTIPDGRATPGNEGDWSPAPTPSVQSSASKPPGRTPKKVHPDAGTTLICRTHGDFCPSSSFERLPKEYKPASKWRSSDVTDNEQIMDGKGTIASGSTNHNVLKPVRQAYTYCLKRQCRYGCILTTEEAFIFRIKPRDETREDLSLSLRDDGMMEYVSIPWGISGRNTLTFNLALWFIHILAGNRHEVAWTYHKLIEEKLVRDVCKLAPNLPITPQTGPRRSRSEAYKNATPPTIRDASRKRKRNSAEGPMYSFVEDSFGPLPEFPDNDSQTSDQTNENEASQSWRQLEAHTPEYIGNGNDADADVDEGRTSKRRRSKRNLRRDQQLP